MNGQVYDGMTAEEYNALLELPGYVGLSYEQIRGVLDPCRTAEARIAAPTGLLGEYGLDINGRIAVGKYFEPRLYVFHPSEEGRFITPDDFNEF
jgi:hypothetical protein